MRTLNLSTRVTSDKATHPQEIPLPKDTPPLWRSLPAAVRESISRSGGRELHRSGSRLRKYSANARVLRLEQAQQASDRLRLVRGGPRLSGRMASYQCWRPARRLTVPLGRVMSVFLLTRRWGFGDESAATARSRTLFLAPKGGRRHALDLVWALHCAMGIEGYARCEAK